jgi:hypothetical protein
MKLVRITAQLSSPAMVRGEDAACPLPIDSILRRATPEGRRRRSAPVPVPIWTLSLAGHDIALGSCAFIDEGQIQQVPAAFVRRKTAQDIESLKGRYHRSLGPGKDRVRRYITIGGRLEWLAVAGHLRSIRKALMRVWWIGAEGAAGGGRVAEWKVEDATEPIECALVRDGVAARPLPPDWCASAAVTEPGFLSHPYYGKSDSLVVPTGAACALGPRVMHELERIRDMVPAKR